jgi:signal transduction histidine kinase
MGIGVVAVLVQLLAILTSFVGSRFQVQAQQLRFAQEFSAGLFRLQDKERRRLARQLHATVAQSLAALKMNLTKLSRSVAEDASILAESVALTDEATKEVRTLSYELHPPLLEEAGLVQSLRWYAKGFAERSGTSVQLDVSPELEQMRMPEGIETTAFRIVQECLSNVHHHSGSATARITVDLEGGNLCVAVEDEGHGMPAERAGGFAGVGLAALRERVKRLGGQLEIHSSSHGTKVSVMVSIERAKLWRNSAS